MNSTISTSPLFRRFISKHKDEILLLIILALFVLTASLEKHWEDQDKETLEIMQIQKEDQALSELLSNLDNQFIGE